jgi:hypothetical protein
MNTKIAKIACFTFVAAALTALPAITRAEDSTNAAAATAPAPKKHATNNLHGKVASVDATAMSFVIGESTIAITSETKITKSGQPAVFDDIKVGENLSVAYKKGADGKMSATTVRIGGGKKNAAPPATNAPAQ